MKSLPDTTCKNTRKNINCSSHLTFVSNFQATLNNRLYTHKTETDYQKEEKIYTDGKKTRGRRKQGKTNKESNKREDSSKNSNEKRN